MIEALIGVAALVVVQIVVFAYQYGKLSQKVDGLAGKVSSLCSNHLPTIEKEIKELSDRISKMGGY